MGIVYIFKIQIKQEASAQCCPTDTYEVVSWILQKQCLKKVNCKPTSFPNHLDFIIFNHHVEGKEKNLISKHGSGLQQRSLAAIKKREEAWVKHSDSQQTTERRCLGWQENTAGWVEARATWNKQLLPVFSMASYSIMREHSHPSLKGTETSPQACRASRLRTYKWLSRRQGWPSQLVPEVLTFKMYPGIFTVSWLHHYYL